MAYDFPAAPSLGQIYNNYVWDGEKWKLQSPPVTGAVRYDIAQGLNSTQKGQARANIDVAKKNYIINGAMVISQENGAAAGTVSGYYPVDMFSSAGAGTTAVISAAQVASRTVSGSTHRLRLTVTTADAAVAAGDTWIIAHQIEGFRAADLNLGGANAKTVTIQFGVKAPAGTYCISLKNGDVNRAYVAEYVIAAGEANSDVVKSVTIQLDNAGTWSTDNRSGLLVSWSLMCGNTYQTAANTWVGGIFNATANQFNFMGTAGNVFELFDVSLTEGSVAPPFQVPDYASELALCRRYWHYISDYFTTVTVATGGSKISHLFSYSTPMRAFPTALRTSFTNVANTISIDAGSVDSLKCEILLSPSNVNVLCTGTAIFTFNARL